MKSSAIFLTWLMMLFGSTFAAETEKYYCDMHQIELTERMILVHIPEGTFETDALQADQGGLYTTQSSLRCIECRRPVDPRNICECPVAQARITRLTLN